MKLELGKRYRDKAGRECVVIHAACGGLDVFYVDHGGAGIYHYEDGRANIVGDFDLVEEIKPTTAPRFKVGETYQARNGNAYKCINVNEDGGAYLTSSARSVAYLWDADGKSVSLNRDYDIVFPPVIEWISEEVELDGKNVAVEYMATDGFVDLSTVRLQS